ncbi:hypothetical protein G7Y89_g6921 [Cudoniella acicularis]|uniref:Uncharacterized protein n=1 Tax=Cudoniella acicularis TaxID=354080 RepID=A0A8H4W2K0_9HELO|nr:hypothetical protein G7Y89_g6921 [Cudoniella acicularis]
MGFVDSSPNIKGWSFKTPWISSANRQQPVPASGQSHYDSSPDVLVVNGVRGFIGLHTALDHCGNRLTRLLGLKINLCPCVVYTASVDLSFNIGERDTESKANDDRDEGSSLSMDYLSLEKIGKAVMQFQFRTSTLVAPRVIPAGGIENDIKAEFQVPKACRVVFNGGSQLVIVATYDWTWYPSSTYYKKREPQDEFAGVLVNAQGYAAGTIIEMSAGVIDIEP